ncbi:transposase [Streptomyces sp. NBC_01214]|uniref:transposase n=1 Tax=Streptomyces sp. NBC_01214 TaxID=2903777 RepID=UPI00224CDBD0|nr:transposase [Streptomyces sp. NBC_01214]MCX4804430.1 transposase [Streptomyces sp. NBC_01214]
MPGELVVPPRTSNEARSPGPIPVQRDAFAPVSEFRSEPYARLTSRADVLYDLSDAQLCTDRPVRTLVDLPPAPEHRRGHLALYSGTNRGRIELARPRGALAGLPLPRASDGRLVLAVDVSPWLRPDANTCSDRSFCHMFGRRLGKGQVVPGWPDSVGRRAGDRPDLMNGPAGRNAAGARRGPGRGLRRPGP